MDDVQQTRAGSGLTVDEPVVVVDEPTTMDVAPPIDPPVPPAAFGTAYPDEEPEPTVLRPGALMDVEDPSSLKAEVLRMVADIEFRLARQYELRLRQVTGVIEKIGVEDMVVGHAAVTGYVMLSNSNGSTTVAGSIAWQSLHVVLMGVDYTIANGFTANKYAWFVKPATYTQGVSADVVLVTGNTLPAGGFGPNDALVFVNNGGVPQSAMESSIPVAVSPGAITNQSLAAEVSSVLTGLRTDITNAQATADGSIVSYFQNDPPWATGTVQDAAKTGDVWYDANDGGQFRWSGPGGTPVNTWVRVADTDTTALAAKVNTKVTTYVSAAAPTAPTGGFTIGDFWVDSDEGNVIKRWDGSAWQTIQLGNGAISGVDGSKIGGVLTASTIPVLDLATKTSGTLQASKVGAGVNGAVLGTATGTVGSTQVAQGAITPPKINAAYHLLY